MPTYADSNRVGLRYIEETEWGTTPAGPVMKELNLTSESLKSNVQTVTSDTIRSDRNVSDITQVGGGAGGDIGFELRYGDIDDLIAGAFQNAWATTAVSATVASAYFSGDTITVSDLAGQDILSGQFLRVGNATTGGNDGDYRVSAVATVDTSTLTLALNDASSGAAASFVSEVFAGSTTLRGKRIRNGTTTKSYTVEKEFSDVSSFAQYAGMRVTSMALNFESQQILTGSFGFMGKSQATSSATLASATTAASTNDVMNASGNVGRVWEGSQAVGGICFQSLSIDLNNNPREQACIGDDALKGVGTGRAEVTGNVTAYFTNNSLIDKFTAGSKSNFRFQVDDADGNSYVVDVPKITYTDFTIAAGGANQDVVQDGTWGASIDDGGAYSIQIDALDA